MTIRTFLEETVQRFPTRPAQIFYEGQTWVTRSFAALRDRAAAAATLVHELGIEPGRENVALMLENGPEWQEIYLALAGCGVAVVPLDPKLRPQEVLHILGDSDAVAIFASAKLSSLLSAISTGLPKLKSFIFVGGAAAVKNRVSLAYELVMTRAMAAIKSAREWFNAHQPTPDNIASIIYTSGTTGLPKGAMLTHGNFTASMEATLAAVKNCHFGPHDNFLNVLPLFHSFAFNVNFLAPLRLGAAMSFVRSLRTVVDDMKRTKPTVLFAVPLLAEKIYARVKEKLDKSALAQIFMSMGLRSLVNHSVRKTFGGKLRFLGIGGAPTAVPVLCGFQRLGYQVLEGYGLTECAPGVAYPDLDYYIPGTVGHILNCMTYKIIDPDATGAGELAVRGPNVMKGYYKNPQATAEAIDSEEYFHTGDVVRFDTAGNLSICGRRKALIVNREGKNIYPEEIEQVIEHHCPDVKDVICLGYHEASDSVGERVGLLVVPDPESKKEDEEVLAEIHEICRNQLADYKLPRKIIIRHDPLVRTSTLKVRRITYEHTLDE